MAENEESLSGKTAQNGGVLEREVWLEENLVDQLGINKGMLYELRKKGLPYIRLSKTRRIYMDSDVYDWLTKQTTKETS